MAGLLDWIGTPEGQGLLAAGFGGLAGARRGQPINSIGRAGMAGLMGYGNAQEREQQLSKQQTQEKLYGAQIKNYESEVAQRQIAADKQAKINGMLEGLFGGSGGGPDAVSPGAFSPSTDGMGPTMPPSMAPAPRQSGIGGMSIDQVAGLKAAGGPDLLDAFKWAKDPLKLEAGSTYQDRTTGKERFIPKLGDGIAAGPNGFYAPLPGYADAQGTIEGAKTAGVERAKAGFDLVQVTGPDGAMRYVPRSTVLGSQPQPAAQPASQPMQPTAPGARPMAPRPGESDRFAILSQELERAKASGNTADAQGIEREIARLPASEKTGASASGLVVPGFQATPTTAQVSQAAADKEYQIGTAKDLVETRKNIMNAGFSAGSNIAKYQQLGKLLSDVDGGALTATGTNIASAMNSLGFKIDKNLPNKEAAAALGNEMALELRNPANGAGMPGAMSDADRNYLVSMIPNASQSAQGRKQLLEAKIAVEQRKSQTATFARNYEKKYGKLDNGFFEQMSAWSAQNPLFKGK